MVHHFYWKEIMIHNLPRGTFDDEEFKIVCGSCGYIGQPDHRVDMKEGELILFCPVRNCETHIGTLPAKKKEVENAN
jgi:hypothetical protein